MPESETRLETLEDEVKVLKGEVKRTLVDLRALLMREDSPLGEEALTRRAAKSGQDRGSDAPGEGISAIAAPPELEMTPAQPNGNGAAGPAEILSQEAPAPLEFGLPADDLPGGPPPAGPGPGPVPGPPVAPASGPPDPPPGDAEEHVLNHSSPASPDSPTEPAHRADQGREQPVAEDLPGAGPELTPSAPGRNGHASQPHQDSGGAAGEPAEPGPAGRNVSVYDEYRELLEETRQTHPIEDNPVGPPLDINLLSNLVYWTARAKQRVGEDQMQDILELYIQSGHSRPELKDLLMQVSGMVDGRSPADNENPRDWVELMFHLHGILTGGFPVIKLPQMQLTGRGQGDGDRH